MKRIRHTAEQIIRKLKTAEQLTFLFEPRQLHLELADLLGQFSFLRLSLLLVLDLLTSGEQVAGSVEELALPLTYLDGVVNGVIGCDLLDRLAATDRLHGNPGLIQSVSQAFLPRLRAWVEVGGIASSQCLRVSLPQPISI